MMLIYLQTYLTFYDDGEKKNMNTDLTISSSRNVTIDADAAISLDADSMI